MILACFIPGDFLRFQHGFALQIHEEAYNSINFSSAHILSKTNYVKNLISREAPPQITGLSLALHQDKIYILRTLN